MTSCCMNSRAAARMAAAGCLVLLLLTVAGAASVSSVQVRTTINPVSVNTIAVATTTPSTTTCQSPFTCMFPGEADSQWGSGNYVSSGSTPCGYATGVTAAAAAKYCYAQTVACTDPCTCMSPAAAREQWGTAVSQCSASPCGRTPAISDTIPASVNYCYRSSSSLVSVARPEVTVFTNATICSGGLTFCSGTTYACTNTSTDAKNCGQCGTSCGLNKVCSNGKCIYQAQPVEPTDPCLLQGKRTCSGKCVDTTADVFNCGACGNTCDQGFKCISGQCSLGCAQGLSECLYDCVNLKTDPQNCGSCGKTCDTAHNQECRNGLCACKGNMLICNPSVGCSDVDSNPKQCGSCNNVCGPKENCVQGHCTNICDLGPAQFSRFSWADKQGMNWMTGVRDQNGCGSCWAMATLGVTEAMYNIEQGRQMSLDLSEQDLMSCSTAGNCAGGWPFNAATYVKDTGVVTETCEPYTASNAACGYSCPNPNANRWKITQYTALSLEGSLPRNTNTWKQNILCKGPLAVCDYNHCVTIVGWDDSIQSWIFKNSWTEGWGNNGYGTRPYNNDQWMKFAWWWGGVTQ